LVEDDFLEARELVVALESAPNGEPALDLRIRHGIPDAELRIAATDAAITAELSPDSVEAILGDMVSPYSRSLDASLPGENIVFTMCSREKGKWVAVQRDGDGREYVSWAATEALARRAAAIRCLARMGAGRPADAHVVPFVAAEDEVRARPAEARATASENVPDTAHQPAWKVSF
jgi:hypothetical protein